MPRISSAKIEPIWANWSRCSARASALAPQSSSTEGPSRAGIGTAIAGRITPGSRLISSSPAASMAPVFPAETTASASPLPDRAAGGDERAVRFRADGFRGLVVHRDHLLGGDVLEPACVERGRAVENRDDPVGGSCERAGDDLIRAAVAAHGVDGDSGGQLRMRGDQRLDLAALVRLAVRADAMRPLGLAAGRADVDARGFDPVLGTPLVATGFRGFLLGDCHWSRGSIATGRASTAGARPSAGRPVPPRARAAPAFRSRPQSGQSPAQSERQRILSGSARMSASRAQADRSSRSSVRYGVVSSSVSGLVAWYSVSSRLSSTTASVRQRTHGPCSRTDSWSPRTMPVEARVTESSAGTFSGTAT